MGVRGGSTLAWLRLWRALGHARMKPVCAACCAAFRSSVFQGRGGSGEIPTTLTQVVREQRILTHDWPLVGRRTRIWPHSGWEVGVLSLRSEALSEQVPR